MKLVKFSFHFSNSMQPFPQPHFAESPIRIEIGQLVPYILVEACQEQEETKDIFCFVWFYLIKINLFDLQLILL